MDSAYRSLDPGALLAYETPCTTYDFTVTGHKVVAAGSAVYNTPGPSLVLVTCWPTDALWFTPDRLLVTATETRVVPTTGSAPAAGAGYSPPRVAAPVALVAEGLTLATNDIPMGTMTLAGSPDPAFVQSPGPLDVEQSALEAFIGGAKALAGGERGWWDALAPGVAEPEGLVGAQLGGYSGGLDVTITVAGGDPQAVELTSEVTVSGGRAPGSYALRVAEVVHDGSLRIASWHLDAP